MKALTQHHKFNNAQYNVIVIKNVFRINVDCVWSLRSVYFLFSGFEFSNCLLLSLTIYINDPSTILFFQFITTITQWTVWTSGVILNHDLLQNMDFNLCLSSRLFLPWPCRKIGHTLVLSWCIDSITP